jgi:hypothetical protein
MTEPTVAAPAAETQSPTVPATPEGLPPAAVFARKLNKAQSLIQTVAKNGENKFHGYKYATAEDIIREVKAVLGECGLAFLPRLESVEKTAIKIGKQKNDGWLVEVKMTYRLMCTDTGYAEEVSFVGAGEDTSDKGIYKAYTGALKYSLVNLFQIPTGDDPEQHGARERSEGKAEAAEAAQATTRQPPTPEVTGKLLSLAADLGGVFQETLTKRWPKVLADAGYAASVMDTLDAERTKREAPATDEGGEDQAAGDDGGVSPEAPSGDSETEPATDAQLELIRKVSGSHVFTDDEHDKLDAALADGMDKDTAGVWIDWLTGVVDFRKAREACERGDVPEDLAKEFMAKPEPDQGPVALEMAKELRAAIRERRKAEKEKAKE